VEGDRLYYVSNRCELICADVAGDPHSTGKGKILWSLDMRKDLVVYPGGLEGGMAGSSPLVLGDLVYVGASNGVDMDTGKPRAPEAPSFLAVHKDNGKVAWGSNLPGGGILDLQFGSPAAAEVNGVVFADANGDHVQNNGEPGVGGATGTLTGLDYRGNPVTLTAKTNPDGSYGIVDAPPGGPAGYRLTSNRPSGYGPPGPTSRTIRLKSGSDAPDQNFALSTSTIRGVVYQDLNLDGVQEPSQGESGLGGVTVALTGVDVNGRQVTATAVTGADGSFSFTGLLAGAYSLHETQPAGYYNGLNRVGTAGGVLGTRGSDVIGAIPLGAGTTAADYEFGEFKPFDAEEGALAKLSGYVYHDRNDNNLFEQDDEEGIAGVAVTLNGVSNKGQALARTALTDAAGFYEFDRLPPGTYQVFEERPGGWLDGGDSLGTVNGAPTGAPAGKGEVVRIALPKGGEGRDYDFGELAPAALEGSVLSWQQDVDGNSFLEALSDVPVHLTGVDDRGATVRLETRTAHDGSYRFRGLRPGTYSVQPTDPRGLLPLKANVGAADGKEENPRRVADIRLKSGECGKAYDFEVEAALRVQGGGGRLDPRRGQCVLPTGVHEEAEQVGAGRTANPAETSGLALGIGLGVVAPRQEGETADKRSRRVEKPTNGSSP